MHNKSFVLFAMASLIIFSGNLIGPIISFHSNVINANMVTESSGGASYSKIFLTIKGDIRYFTSTGFGILGPVWQSSERSFLLGRDPSESNWIKIEIGGNYNLVPLKPGGGFSIPVNVVIHQLIGEKVGAYVIRAAGFSLCFGVAFKNEKNFPEGLLKYIEVSSSPISIEVHKRIMWGFFASKACNYTLEVFPYVHNYLRKYSWHWGRFLMIGEWGRKGSRSPIYNGTICFLYPTILNGKAITKRVEAVYYFSLENQRELREYRSEGIQLCVMVQLAWWIIAPDGNKVGEIVVTEPIVLGGNVSTGGKEMQEFQIKLIENGDSSDPAYMFSGGKYVTTVEVESFGKGVD